MNKPSMGTLDRRAFDLDLIRGVWARRKWLAVLVFAPLLAAVIGAIPFLPNVYKASAIVLVERQQVPEEFVKSTVTSLLETRLHTMSQEILSRGHLQELITRLDLYPELRRGAQIEAVVERMRRDIRVELKGVDTFVRGGALVAFTVSYTGSDPKKAALVANTLASYYIEENTRVREHQATGTADFLRRQLEETKQRLEEQESRVSAFKKRYIGETPQNLQTNLAILDRLNSQLRLNSDNQSRATERREALARQLVEAESLTSLLSDATPFGGALGSDPRATRLARLRQELAELRTRFSDKYPDVVRLKAEIAEVERQQREEQNKDATAGAATAAAAPAASPFVVQLKEALADIGTELKTLKVEEKRLREDLATYQRRVENTPTREIEFIELSRDYDTTSEQYRTLWKRYEEAQLAGTLEQRQKGEQFRILESAVPPKEPSAPKRARLLLMGLVLSAGLAAGAVLLTEQLDTSFHGSDDLRAVAQVPVLVSIPRIVTEQDLTRLRWRHRAWIAATIVGVMVVGGSAYLVAKGWAPVVSPLALSLLLGS